MNWTGGHLQRSKANASRTVKTQKQHFAKTRLRSQNGGAIRSSIALFASHGQRGYNAEREGGMPIGGHRGPRKRPCPQQGFQHEHPDQFGIQASRHLDHTLIGDSPPKRRRYDAPLDGVGSHLVSTGTSIDRQGHNLARRRKPSSTSIISSTSKFTAAKENTLQSIKRELLKTPDWMGLSAARPLKITFTPVEEMEKICKRRKIKITDEQSTARAQPTSVLCPAISRHRHRRRIGQCGSSASLQQTQDASIRIGGTIHQTQETPWLSSKEWPSPNTAQVDRKSVV